MEHVKVVRCKLDPTPEQHEALKETVTVFANACNYALPIAIEHNTGNKFRLRELCYYGIRERFHLSSNLAIQATRRVADAFKIARQKGRKPKEFRPKSVPYDQRIFSLKEVRRGTIPEYEASLSTMRGRVKGIKLHLAEYQRYLLQHIEIKSATLVYDRKHNRFFLNIVVKRDLPDPKADGRVVGVDLGINNLATTSHGMRFPGGEADNTRGRYSRLRAALDAKGTRSAIRTLNRSKQKEQRWMRDRNHAISRRIVDSLQAGDVIALEDLTHIRKRTRRRGAKQRRRHHSWAFRQLQQFVEYKALERGIAVVYVDPRNTSKSCSRCGAIGARSKHSFFCLCRYRNHADYNGAHNIATRGHALVAGLSSCSPNERILQRSGVSKSCCEILSKATPVETKTTPVGLRSRASASPSL